MFQSHFQFLEPGRMADGALELVEPAPQWIDALLNSQHHPATVTELPHLLGSTRAYVMDFLVRHPRGRSTRDEELGRVPSYYFWMHLRGGYDLGPLPPLTIAGGVGLRVGSSWDIEQIAGHIGYNVYPAARGYHLAERATRLLLPLAARHGIDPVWITCNPDNEPSRRTCERLGARLIETVPVPRDHPLYLRGDHEKCRYRLQL